MEGNYGFLQHALHRSGTFQSVGRHNGALGRRLARVSAMTANCITSNTQQINNNKTRVRALEELNEKKTKDVGRWWRFHFSISCESKYEPRSSTAAEGARRQGTRPAKEREAFLIRIIHALARSSMTGRRALGISRQRPHRSVVDGLVLRAHLVLETLLCAQIHQLLSDRGEQLGQDSSRGEKCATPNASTTHRALSLGYSNIICLSLRMKHANRRPKSGAETLRAADRSGWCIIL